MVQDDDVGRLALGNLSHDDYDTIEDEDDETVQGENVGRLAHAASPQETSVMIMMIIRMKMRMVGMKVKKIFIFLP